MIYTYRFLQRLLKFWLIYLFNTKLGLARETSGVVLGPTLL